LRIAVNHYAIFAIEYGNNRLLTVSFPRTPVVGNGEKNAFAVGFVFCVIRANVGMSQRFGFVVKTMPFKNRKRFAVARV
jgi:hypothetical protein